MLSFWIFKQKCSSDLYNVLYKLSNELSTGTLEFLQVNYDLLGHLKMADVMKSLEEKQAEYKSKGFTRVKLGLTDIDGVIRGKYISVDKFFSILETQGGFCDCVFGWDVNDELY